MSVHLSLTKTLNGTEVDIPVASESFFLKAWRPLALQLSLPFVESMQSGYDLTQESLLSLLKELNVMEKNILASNILPKEDLRYLHDKIVSIIETLNKEVEFPEVKGWIG